MDIFNKCKDTYKPFLFRPTQGNLADVLLACAIVAELHGSKYLVGSLQWDDHLQHINHGPFETWEDVQDYLNLTYGCWVEVP